MKTFSGLLLILMLTAGGVGYRLHTRVLPHIPWQPAENAVGVFHVHSARSHDSGLSLNEIAETASGLQVDFVVLTDHNAQAAPVEIKNTTLLSFAELSTKNGHVIQLGVPALLTKAEKNSLTLGPDLKKRGGAAVIAHPTDIKRPWNGRWRDIGGIEIASSSAAARQVGGPSYLGLLPALVTFPINSRLALARLYGRDDKALKRWDETSAPHQAGFCGVDAHGRINLRQNLQLWKIHLEKELPKPLMQRASTIVNALKEGRFYCAAGLFGDSPTFRFQAKKGGDTVGTSGDTVSESEVSDLVINAPTVLFPDSEQQVSIVLFRDGEEILRHQGSELRYPAPPPGTYRTEVRIPVPNLLVGYTMTPIIYSNKLRVTRAE